MNFPHSVYLFICSSAGVPTTSVLDSEVAPSTVTAADPGEPTGDVAAVCEDKTRYNWTQRQSNLLNCKPLNINYITNAFAIKKKKHDGLIKIFLIFWPFSDYCSISFCFHSATPYIPIDRPLPFPFLTWGAGSSPSLLSLQVFLVAYRAHAVGAGVTVETASHGAKHWHLGLVGLLSHAVTEGQGGWERISLGGNRKMDPWLWLSAVCLFYFRVAWFQFDRSWWKAFFNVGLELQTQRHCARSV